MRPSAALPPLPAGRRRRLPIHGGAPVPLPPLPSSPMNPMADPRTTAPTAHSQPDPPTPTDAPRSGMDYPSGAGPSRHMKADDNPGGSLISLSCSILADELYVTAKETLLAHFKEVVAEEMTKVLCPQYEGSISQEPADTCESMDRSRTPPHVSQTTTAESSSLAAMQNNPPYLALIWQNESHVTMIKLADDPSKHVEDFLSDNHASERFGACYVAPVNNIQEVTKKEILVDLNANYHFNNQQHVECISSSGIREGRPYHMKRKTRIDQESPINVGAFLTSPSKKRRCGNMSNPALNGPNHPNGKRPIDQASPTDVGTSPTGPLKKKRRTRLIMELLNTVPPCDAANLKSQKDLKLVSPNDGLCTEKEKPPSYYREKKTMPIPCRSKGSARTSIDGLQWLKWSQNATRVEKDIVRGGNAAMQAEKASFREWSFTKQSPCIDARDSRAKVRNLLVKAACPQLANSIQMKGRIKELRVERSLIHGWGVLAVKDIKHGELVVEYIGEVISKLVSDMRELQYEKAGRGDYFFKIDANHVIDATRRGGIARYINHSCEPNCDTRVITVTGQKKIYIYAKNNIRAGQELTYNYKFPLDENKILCLCGSKRCRGAMN